jgi:antitoxin MazE
MISQISKWGNSQGIRISKKLLQSAGMRLNDEVEIRTRKDTLVIKPTAKKTLAWYLDGYDSELDRYDWGNSDEPKGRELL